MKNHKFIMLNSLYVMLSVTLVFFIIVQASASIGNEEIIKHTGYNVVFVMDTSGSLEGEYTDDPATDPEGFRKQGLDMFLSWLPGSNSRVGLVTFSTVAEEFEKTFRPIESSSDVQLISLAAQKPSGEYTNLTEGLEKAVNFFTPENGMDPNLPNLILIFTDGVLTLPNREDIASSTTKMINLADDAKARNIKISVIALNNGGVLDKEKLQDVSGIVSDNKLFKEVKNSKDLIQKFEEIHDTLFYFRSKDLKEGKDFFLVPKNGVSSINFTFTPNSNDEVFQLISPDNKDIYTRQAAYEMNGVVTINISEPDYGMWHSHILGEGTITIPEDKNISKKEKLENSFYDKIGLLLIYGVVMAAGFMAQLGLSVMLDIFKEHIGNIIKETQHGFLKASFAIIVCIGVYSIMSTYLNIDFVEWLTTMIFDAI